MTKPNIMPKESAAITALREPLSQRSTSAEFNEWMAREVVEHIDAQAERIAELEHCLKAEIKSSEKDDSIWHDNYSVLESKLAHKDARIKDLESSVIKYRDALYPAVDKAAKGARNAALREAAHECEQVAYSGKYPQDDQSELGCLRCRDNILARIEGDTND